MKKYLLVLFLFLFGVKGFSQEALSQAQQKSENYQKAEFSGGNEAFQKEFMNMVHAYIDFALYAVQGEVTFVFNINSKGKIDRVEGYPKFKNNDMFMDDIRYAAKKVKGKWKPATKNGDPVDSKFVIKVKFNNYSYDAG